MRWVIGAFTLLVLMAATVAAQDSTGADEPAAGTESQKVYSQSKMMFAVKRANVRAGPSTGHVRTGLLEVGERVSVVAKVGDWFELRRRAGQPRRFVHAPLLTDVIPSTSKPSAAQSTASASTGETLAYDGGQYRGPTRNGRPHGRGVVTYPDGERFEGEFVNGERHGHGVEFYADGSRYEGEFVFGKYTDYGTVVWANGNRYEGEWRGNERTGRGVFTWPNGNRYEGDFVDGSLTGLGVFTWPSGSRYEGDWRDGKRHGRGAMTWADGDRYEGEWLDDKKHGIGMIEGPSIAPTAVLYHQDELVTHAPLDAGSETESTQQSGDTWTAFVNAPNTYGASAGYPDRDNAFNAAVQKCKQEGGHLCGRWGQPNQRIAKSRCIAVATAEFWMGDSFVVNYISSLDNYPVDGTAKTRERAEHLALSYCRDYMRGEVPCHIDAVLCAK